MIAKFRAWEPYKNKMNYKVMVGNCDQDDDNWTCPIIWDEERREWVHFDDFDCIMQSTGLFDKNGVEIFEGDVVECYTVFEEGRECNYKGVVIFKSFSWFIIDSQKTIEYLEHYDTGWSDWVTEITVIGNIYENPELEEDEEWN